MILCCILNIIFEIKMVHEYITGGLYLDVCDTLCFTGVSSRLILLVPASDTTNGSEYSVVTKLVLSKLNLFLNFGCIRETKSENQRMVLEREEK
ncbi:hypothetical protein HanIR_Chr05g0210321 [Helianthus annuus]|nr:hypothetical protein HanIR_Chr05g0210321 [Helianthus annuus]